MRVLRASASTLVVALVASLVALAAPGKAEENSPGAPTTEQNVQPELVAGNPKCIDYGLHGGEGDEANGGRTGGVPIAGEEIPTGPGTVTIDDMYDDPNGIEGAQLFDWSSTGVGISMVIVKGGSNANAYVYDLSGPAFSDKGLHPAINGENGKYFGYSHVDFCYGDDTPEEDPDPAHLNVVKFYDANANGINDDGQEITGWKINISPTPGDTFTEFDDDVAPGEYTVSEYPSTIGNWVATTPTSVGPFTLAENDNELVEFGNLCLGGGGGHTLGFWSNKNGQALISPTDRAELDLLNLQNPNGSDFSASSTTAVKNFLLGASATNMANMLSAQLAAMKLNVLEGFVSGSALIFAHGTTSANALGFATVDAVMSEANASLGGPGNNITLAGHAERAHQEALKNALDNANNNVNFVQATPCAFSFEEQVALATVRKAKKHKRHRNGRGGRGR